MSGTALWLRAAITALVSILAITRPRSAQAAEARTADDFADVHFHLTNYIQEGTDIRDFLRIMGPAGGPLHPVRHPATADLVLRELRDLRADLLSAERRPSVLLLLHRRLHRDGLPVTEAGGTSSPRSNDHGLQPC